MSDATFGPQMEEMRKEIDWLIKISEEKDAQIETLRKSAQHYTEYYNQTRNKDASTTSNEEEEISSPRSQSGEPPFPRHNQRHAPDFKVDIPDFEGRLDVDDFVEWLRIVESVFDNKQTPEHKKVKIVALKFRKYASIWWAGVCAKRARQGKDKVHTWKKMKKLLKEKFLPSYYMQDNFSKFHHLEQGNSSVEEYAREFESYLMKCGVNEDEPQTLVRFLGGLDTRIARVVEPHPYTLSWRTRHSRSQGRTTTKGQAQIWIAKFFHSIG